MKSEPKRSAYDHFVENTALSKMAPKLTISLQTKSCMFFSVIFNILSEKYPNTGRMYIIK